MREQEARILVPTLATDVPQRLVHVPAVHGQQPLLAFHAARGQVELEHQIVRDSGGDAALLSLLARGQPAAAARLLVGVLEAAAQRAAVVLALRYAVLSLRLSKRLLRLLGLQLSGRQPEPLNDAA